MIVSKKNSPPRPPSQEAQVASFVVTQELLDLAYQLVGDRIEGAIYRPSKVERYSAVNALEGRGQSHDHRTKYPEDLWL